MADRPDEANIVEAPSLVRHGCRDVLFYSGNTFNSVVYFVNYATASSLHGHYALHEGQLLNKADLDRPYQNPGGEDVRSAAHDNFMVFHANTSPTVRALVAVGLRWDHHDHHDHPMLDLTSRPGLHFRP